MMFGIANIFWARAFAQSYDNLSTQCLRVVFGILRFDEILRPFKHFIDLLFCKNKG